MPDNLPRMDGSVCSIFCLTASEKKTLACRFLPVDHHLSPSIEGLLPRRQEIKMDNPLYQKHIISINDLSRDI